MLAKECRIVLMAIRHLALPVKLAFKNKEEIAPDVFKFNFAIDKPLHWQAGQHGILEIMLPNGRTGRRPFSISSAPSEGVISITTRADQLQGSIYKRALMRLKKGSTAKLRGPVGKLYIKDPTKNYAFMATGTGITPFRSILQEQANLKSKTNITLFFVNNDHGHYYKDLLSELNQQLPNLTIKYIFRPDRITGQLVEEVLGEAIDDTIFLLAGSVNTVKSYRRTLQGLQVPSKNIISDPFYGFHPKKVPELIKSAL